MKVSFRPHADTTDYGWLPLLILASLVISICLVVVPHTEAYVIQCGNPCIGGESPFNAPYSGFYPDCIPINIDVSGNDLQLTNAQNGVMFDNRGTGSPLKKSWTDARANNAFLVLDRNGNGI